MFSTIVSYGEITMSVRFVEDDGARVLIEHSADEEGSAASASEEEEEVGVGEALVDSGLGEAEAVDSAAQAPSPAEADSEGHGRFGVDSAKYLAHGFVSSVRVCFMMRSSESGPILETNGFMIFMQERTIRRGF